MIRLNLGCGFNKIPGLTNIDCDRRVNPDLLCDIENGLPFEDSTVDEIFAKDFLEHIHPDKVIFVIEEIYRVLKPKGKFESITPSTDGRGAFQDPTHRSFWNINSWLYYTDDAHRSFYNINAKFEVLMLVDFVGNERLKVIYTQAVLLKSEKELIL